MLLAIYDLSGIQSFLFSSNKLREISGASAVVHDVLFFCLPALFGEAESDWKTRKTISLDKGEEKKIVYIGGGNALVLYDTEKTCTSVTRELEKQVFLSSGGGIRLCSAWITLDEDVSLAENQKRLMEKLDETKKTGGNHSPAPAFPVTAYDNNNYEPILLFDGGVCSSAVKYAKQAISDTESGFRALYPERHPPILREFDKARRENAKNYLAVIHIDGNTMGIRIRKFIDSLAASGDGIFSQMERLRTLSVRISELYQDTVRETLEVLWKDKDPAKEVCFRPVVADGDDITVMISASDAFPFVRTFLSKLEQKRIAEFSEAFKPTAAAGIAFVGLRFPFSVAYDMAESCCKNAKKETILRCGGAEAFGERPVSSFDYQLCVSNIPEDIGNYRQKHFVFSKGDAEYRLMRRPYLFSESSEYSAERFFAESDALFENMRNKSIARSKLKGLRNAYGTGVQEAERYTEFICAHAKTEDELSAAKCFGQGPFNEKREARFFDILDVMDIIRKEEQT